MASIMLPVTLIEAEFILKKILKIYLILVVEMVNSLKCIIKNIKYMVLILVIMHELEQKKHLVKNYGRILFGQC